MVVRHWLPKPEKTIKGGRKESTQGRVGLILRRLGKEPAISVVGRGDIMLEGDGWVKSMKVARW